jgi:uncharacterized repeat protein (TIGR03803 family)
MLACKLSSLSVIVLLLLLSTASTLSAQQFQLLHFFVGQDGALPRAGLTIDAGDKLFGTTYAGFQGFGWGSAFEIRPHNQSFQFYTIQALDGQPLDRPVFAPNGKLYNTTSNAIFGPQDGYVYSLQPPLRFCSVVRCFWGFHAIYGFPLDGTNGILPGGAVLAFDPSSNIYGTTQAGGANGKGVVYKITPAGVETILYNFAGPDGAAPYAGVIFDQTGNLYGAAAAGGDSNQGTIYKLTPDGQGGYSQSVLYNFTGGSDGGAPLGGLIFDAAGNLYGNTSTGGSGGGGTVYELSPNGGGWNYQTLYSFTGGAHCGPKAELSFDASGSLYGTTYCDGAFNDGSVFKLTNSGGTWNYTSMHDFADGNDGKFPYSNVVFDHQGRLYGTAERGSIFGAGDVWQITP